MIRRTACLIARDTDVYRNLAIEKHLMDTLPDATAVLYLWQNRRAVVVGRNQDPWKECAVGALLSEGGQAARRLSGGGAQYHDMGSLHFSLVVPKPMFDISRQWSVIGMALAAMGIQTRMCRSGLIAPGGLCCDGAYFKSSAAALHHGTLLVDTDLGQLDRFLSAEEGARPSEGLCTLARSLPGLAVAAVQEAIYHAFAHVYGGAPAMLDERTLDQHSIRQLTEQFSDSRWIFPREETFSLQFSERFPWGGVTVKMRTEGAVIRAARLYTDAMEAGLFPLIEQALTGAPCLISSLCSRIDQKLAQLRDTHLLQIAEDIKSLIRRQLRGR